MTGSETGEIWVRWVLSMAVFRLGYCRVALWDVTMGVGRTEQMDDSDGKKASH